MVIKGIKNGDVKVCVKTDPNVPRCLAKFKVTPTQDCAAMTRSAAVMNRHGH